MCDRVRYTCRHTERERHWRVHESLETQQDAAYRQAPCVSRKPALLVTAHPNRNRVLKVKDKRTTSARRSRSAGLALMACGHVPVGSTAGTREHVRNGQHMPGRWPPSRRSPGAGAHCAAQRCTFPPCAVPCPLFPRTECGCLLHGDRLDDLESEEREVFVWRVVSEDGKQAGHLLWREHARLLQALPHRAVRQVSGAF